MQRHFLSVDISETILSLVVALISINRLNTTGLWYYAPIALLASLLSVVFAWFVIQRLK